MERINFASPGVTVIVGHNGSGKTTIVECLKYATTGDQPPNTKGGAFVHDPKMAGEKEVKAQVKLRFYARNRVRMTATRNLMVTAKKAGQTMKTLESLLDAENPNSNKRSTISTKCAEIDAEIPNLLGVSKAVLENVIFCHQEESYWPLAEASVLKKKFDDIFEATKYTKALENIKVIKKERVAELKVDKERLDNVSNEKKRAEKITKLMNDLGIDVAQKEIEIAELHAQEDQITAENTKFYDQSMKFKEYYMRAEELEKRKRTDKEDARGLEEALGKERLPPSVSDEELETQERNFEASSKTRQEEVQKLMKALSDDQKNEVIVRRKLKDLERERGVLEGDAERHKSHVAEREEVIRKLNDIHSITMLETQPLDQFQVDDFISSLRVVQRRLNSETEKIQDAINGKRAECNSKTSELRAQVTSAQRDRTATDAQIRRLETAVIQAETVIDQNKSLEVSLKDNTQDLVDQRTRLERLNQELEGARYDEQLSQKAKEIQQAEVERDALHSEQSRSSLQANDRAKLDIKKADYKKRSAEIDHLLEIHNEKHLAIVGVDAQAKSMEDDVDKLHSTKTRELARLETAFTKANREAMEVAGAHTRMQKAVGEKTAELQSVKEKLATGLELNGSSTLAAAIQEANEEIAANQEQAGLFNGTGEYFRKLLVIGKDQNSCDACKRLFANTQQFKVFEKAILAAIAETSEEKIAETAAVVKRWATELNRLQEFLPVEANIERLEEEIPKLSKSLMDLAQRDEACKLAYEKTATDLKNAKSIVAELAVLRDAARTVSRNQDEVDVIRKEIKELERGLQSTGSLRTATDVQTELDAALQLIKKLNRDKQLISTEKEHNLTAQRTVENKIHALELREGKLRNQLQEGNATAEKLDKDKDELGELRQRLPSFATLVSKLQESIAEIDTAFKSEERQLIEKLRVAKEKARMLDASVLELDGVHSRIEKYLEEDRPARLQTCVELASKLEHELQKVVALLENRRTEHAAVNKEINQGGAKASVLRDNRRLRGLERRIDETEAELLAIPMEEAAQSKQTFEAKWDRMTRKEKEVKAKSSRLTGEVNMTKAQITGYKKELANDFKDISKKYMEQLVKVKMSDMVNNDLEKYAKALDTAIMKYHSLKMEEVNDTMKHLWNKTYQGTDIDGIQIKSEGEGAANKRSYNYRVVMTKDSTEMDMRGRCSAGQKMLASIIIRLALSDSFGQDCGILALDEPTNALDTENIEALASSLVEIINERRKHANFQLIIITHDENFLRKMGESGVIEDYWRVARNDRQKSIIEKHILA